MPCLSKNLFTNRPPPTTSWALRTAARCTAASASTALRSLRALASKRSTRPEARAVRCGVGRPGGLGVGWGWVFWVGVGGWGWVFQRKAPPKSRVQVDSGRSPAFETRKLVWESNHGWKMMCCTLFCCWLVVQCWFVCIFLRSEAGSTSVLR